jgi:hypothetical protein
MASPENRINSWRDCQNAREFCAVFGLPDRCRQVLDQYAARDFTSEILAEMELYFNRVKDILGQRRDCDFDWNYLHVQNGLTTEDNLMSLYASMLKETNFPDARDRFAEQYIQILRQHIPKSSAVRREVHNDNYNLLQKAFHRPERGPRNVAEPIYNQIAGYYLRYDSAVYGGPYTSIVGPSGIGKSFVIQSIARQDLAYVVYVSLAQPHSTAYPRRSRLAQLMINQDTNYTITDRATMTTIFECYIAASMVHVRLCRTHGIHPLDFF